MKTLTTSISHGLSTAGHSTENPKSCQSSITMWIHQEFAMENHLMWVKQCHKWLWLLNGYIWLFNGYMWLFDDYIWLLNG